MLLLSPVLEKPQPRNVTRLVPSSIVSSFIVPRLTCSKSSRSENSGFWSLNSCFCIVRFSLSPGRLGELLPPDRPSLQRSLKPLLGLLQRRPLRPSHRHLPRRRQRPSHQPLFRGPEQRLLRALLFHPDRLLLLASLRHPQQPPVQSQLRAEVRPQLRPMHQAPLLPAKLRQERTSVPSLPRFSRSPLLDRLPFAATCAETGTVSLARTRDCLTCASLRLDSCGRKGGSANDPSLAHSRSKDGSRIDTVADHLKAVSERAAEYAAAFGAADEHR